MRLKNMLAYSLNSYKKVFVSLAVTYFCTAVFIFLLDLKEVKMNSVFSLVGSVVVIIVSWVYQEEFLSVSVANSISRKTSTISMFIMGLIFSVSNSVVTIAGEYAMEKLTIKGMYTAKSLIAFADDRTLPFVTDLLLQITAYFFIVIMAVALRILTIRFKKIEWVIWLTWFISVSQSNQLLNAVYNFMHDKLLFDIAKTGNTFIFFWLLSLIFAVIIVLVTRRLPYQNYNNGTSK